MVYLWTVGCTVVYVWAQRTGLCVLGCMWEDVSCVSIVIITRACLVGI